MEPPGREPRIGMTHTVGAAHRLGLNKTAEAMAIVWSRGFFDPPRKGAPRLQQELTRSTRPGHGLWHGLVASPKGQSRGLGHACGRTTPLQAVEACCPEHVRGLARPPL